MMSEQEVSSVVEIDLKKSLLKSQIINMYKKL